MAQRYFMLTLSTLPVLLSAGLYAYAYSLGGRRARLVLSLGIPEIPHLVGDFFWLFWRGRHAASRQPRPSSVFAGVAGAEGATEAGLRVPATVSAYQAAADEEARILAGFDRIVADLSDPAGSGTGEHPAGWFASFHEETAASPVYRAWVLETTGEMRLDELSRRLAEGRELVPAG
jgi:hypothetical protein